MAEEEKSPAQVLAQRKKYRKFAPIYLNVVAVLCIIFGHRGWYVEMIPMHYVGYFLLLVGVMGFCGVNIWRSGPLDPRDDPTQDDIDDWVDLEEE